jgi:hypothetical protein
MPTQQAPTSTFVNFPGMDEVLCQLRATEGAGREHEPLFRLVGERLALKTYDRSAFVFILIELVYEFEEIAGHDLSDLLSRMVRALTDDPELAESGLDAYEEIKASLEPNAEGDDELEPAPPVEDPSADDTAVRFLDDAPAPAAVGPHVPAARGPDQERLMIELQEAQKQVADLGLSARMSIDMSLSRPSREGVSHSLREIAALRSILRDFEALLGAAETRILEEIGVLDRD